MKKKLFILSVLLLFSQIKAEDNFGSGVAVGSIIGLAGGTILNNLTQPKPAVVFCEDPCVEQKRAELHVREREIRRAELEQRRRSREQELQRRHRGPRPAARWVEAQEPEEIVVQDTIVETQTLTPKEKSLRERELELREKEVQLELLREQNKQAELELENKKIELELIKARESQKVTTKKITRKIIS